MSEPVQLYSTPAPWAAIRETSLDAAAAVLDPEAVGDHEAITRLHHLATICRPLGVFAMDHVRLTLELFSLARQTAHEPTERHLRRLVGENLQQLADTALSLL